MVHELQFELCRFSPTPGNFATSWSAVLGLCLDPCTDSLVIHPGFGDIPIMATPIYAWGFGGVPSSPNPVLSAHPGELPQKYSECALGLFFSPANCLPSIANRCRSPPIIYLLTPPVPLIRQELGRWQSWTSTGISSNSTGSSVTKCWFSPIIDTLFIHLQWRI
jgi:hypothetical protein